MFASRVTFRGGTVAHRRSRRIRTIPTRISSYIPCMFMFFGELATDSLAITQMGMYHCYLNMGPNPNTLLFTLHSNWYVYDCIDIVYEYDYSILYYTTISGWWFGTCFIFSIQFGNYHPNRRTHIFQRGRSTTNQITLPYGDGSTPIITILGE